MAYAKAAHALEAAGKHLRRIGDNTTALALENRTADLHATVAGMKSKLDKQGRNSYERLYRQWQFQLQEIGQIYEREQQGLAALAAICL